MGYVIKGSIGALAGIALFYLVSAFVTMDWSVNVVAWTITSRAMLAYCVISGAMLGAFKP